MVKKKVAYQVSHNHYSWIKNQESLLDSNLKSLHFIDNHK